MITLFAKKSCDFGSGPQSKSSQQVTQVQNKRPQTAISMVEDSKKINTQNKSISQTRSTVLNKNRSTSKSNASSIQFKTSFDNTHLQSKQNLQPNPQKTHFRSFNKFTGMHANSMSFNHNANNISNIDAISDNVNPHIINSKYSKQVKQQQKDLSVQKVGHQSEQNIKRHSEYNNNEEDYMKSKKDEVIKTIFKKRKEKMLSMETPKELLSHHVSASSALEGFPLNHQHNMSEIEPTLTAKVTILNTDINQPHTNSLQKAIKDKKYRKMAAERTHTPPPPTATGRITNNTQSSNEKTLQTSSSFISKKQTAYINPKNPDETAYVPTTVSQQKLSMISATASKKINIKLNNFTNVNSSQQQKTNQKSERHQRPLSQMDQMQMVSSFNHNVSAVNPHHHSQQNSTHQVQNFQLSKNINVKVQQPLALNYLASFTAHQNTVTDLDIDQMNGILFSSSLDTSVKVWNMSHSNRQRIYDKGGVQYSPFSSDGSNKSNRMSSYSQTSQVNSPLVQIKNNTRSKINCLKFIPSYNVLAVGSFDKTVKLYKIKSYSEKIEPIHSLKSGHQGVINDICRLDDDHLASACADGHIRVFDLSSHSFDKPQTTLYQQESAPSLITSLSPHLLLTTSDSNHYGVCIWDIRTQTVPMSFKQIHYDSITSIERVSQHVFATASDDGNLNVWDWRMTKLMKQIRFENDRIGCIKFVKSSYLLAAHGHSLTLMSISDNFSHKQTFRQPTDHNSLNSTQESNITSNIIIIKGTINQTYNVKQMAFNESDKNLYLAGSDNKIHIWNINFNL